MITEPLREGAEADRSGAQAQAGLVISYDAGAGNIKTAFIEAIAEHRHWERELAQ